MENQTFSTWLPGMYSIVPPKISSQFSPKTYTEKKKRETYTKNSQILSVGLSLFPLFVLNSLAILKSPINSS
ncbi:hypothetical protein K7X08_021232 [Anisodus acutangulus]|uniref:Uncharacterized protein n=1 Tax=Anisodus acutangulus TaxID=402998 RepID=A0A9Q1LZG3_9SOLA|nr:hypothetical protein K7X08_021232 [Anisodus acutangulus]